MEQVLETYKKPYDARKPMVCMDETSKQLVKETRQPIAIEAGQPLRYDYEYERHGVANLFMFCEPLRGWRRVSVTERRTKVDWAQQIKRLVDEDYPDAQRITLVMDNLNTHRLSSLYEAFPPAEARRLIDKLEVVHTPLYTCKFPSRLSPYPTVQPNELPRDPTAGSYSVCTTPRSVDTAGARITHAGQRVRRRFIQPRAPSSGRAIHAAAGRGMAVRNICPETSPWVAL